MKFPKLSGADQEFLTMVGARMLGNPPTLACTLHLCREAIRRRIPGDFVECGVFAGVHPAVMAREVSRSNDTRMVHLFDSFAGIPHAGPKDDHTIKDCIGPESDGALVSTGVSVCTQAQVESHMKEWGIGPSQLRYWPGWFQQTVPKAAQHLADRRIAVLRLDGDLYESTMVCLEHLYPLVPKGGFLIIDDFRLTGCHRACMEYGLFRGDIRAHAVTIEGGEGPVWLQKP